MQTIRAIDLFAGAGGLSIGLEEAGIQVICAVEHDKYAAETYKLHSPNTEVFCEDIRAIDLCRWKGRVQLIAGGPPCQPFSSGGLRNSESDSRDMIPHFIEAIDTIRPNVFLMENVPGLAVGRRADYLARIINQFENLGYTAAWKVLNASCYGVPQIRRRLFIIGIKSLKFKFPEPTHGNESESRLIASGKVLTEKPFGEPNRSKIVYAKNPDLRPSPYHGQLFNGGGRPINLKLPAPTILASAGGNKTHFIDTLNLVPDYHKHLLHGGKPRQGELPGARRLTVEESAILQTFPKHINFLGPRSAKYRQIGNAIPPKLAEILGKAITDQAFQERRTEVLKSTSSIPLQQSLFAAAS